VVVRKAGANTSAGMPEVQANGEHRGTGRPRHSRPGPNGAARPIRTHPAPTARENRQKTKASWMAESGRVPPAPTPHPGELPWAATHMNPSRVFQSCVRRKPTLADGCILIVRGDRRLCSCPWSALHEGPSDEFQVQTFTRRGAPRSSPLAINHTAAKESNSVQSPPEFKMSSDELGRPRPVTLCSSSIMSLGHGRG